MTVVNTSGNTSTQRLLDQKEGVSARSQTKVPSKEFRSSLVNAQELGGAGSVASQRTVQRGNTLTSLTRQFLGASAEQLTPQQLNKLVLTVSNANGLSDPNRIYVGQVIDFSAVLPSQSLAKNELAAANDQPLPQIAPLPKAAIQTNVGLAPRVVVVGDSIALGVGGAMLRSQGSAPKYSEGQKHLVQTETGMAVEATVGLRSPQILNRVKQNATLQNAEVAVISVGTNDMVGMSADSTQGLQQISQNLRQIRSNLKAAQNVWILPYDPKARELVANVAQEYGDKTIDLAQFAKADRYHPKNYTEIANSLNLAQTTAAKPWVSTMSMLQSR